MKICINEIFIIKRRDKIFLISLRSSSSQYLTLVQFKNFWLHICSLCTTACKSSFSARSRLIFCFISIKFFLIFRNLLLLVFFYSLNTKLSLSASFLLIFWIALIRFLSIYWCMFLFLYQNNLNCLQTLFNSFVHAYRLLYLLQYVSNNFKIRYSWFISSKDADFLVSF